MGKFYFGEILKTGQTFIQHHLNSGRRGDLTSWEPKIVLRTLVAALNVLAFSERIRLGNPHLRIVLGFEQR